MHDQIFKKETILDFFRHTGLISFNLAIVIDKVKKKQQVQIA